MLFTARREEDDSLPRGKDRQHEGGEVQSGHQGGVWGDEEVNRKYELYYLTINIFAIGKGMGAGGDESIPIIYVQYL